MNENIGGPPGGHNRRQTIPKMNENALWLSEDMSEDEWNPGSPKILNARPSTHNSGTEVVTVAPDDVAEITTPGVVHVEVVIVCIETQ